ncbi:argininosuccinate synthase [Candidatus Micrarchaeota archaeon]|nr:argininosuccinate synthase [Candidatus Micrarchaeota archaeon]
MEIYSSYEATSAKKVVLLYSGGLDTSCMLRWIPEQYGSKLIALTIDLGQPADFLAIKSKAENLGAEKAIILDAKKEFAERYISKAIMANALYEGAYPISTALARPLIAKKAVEIALLEGADAIAHGCTGKGNDQVRIETTILAMAPEMKIIAPIRSWKMNRDDEIRYANENGIPIPEKSKYSTDDNLWGRSVECDVLEYPDREPPSDAFEWCELPENAPSEPEYVKIGFAKGVPVELNGKTMGLLELVLKLNFIAGKHGIGVIDHMEDRVVGLKSRELYECPAAVCILKAHKDLQKAVSTIHQNHFIYSLEEKWAQMAYLGLWQDPLMENLDAAIKSANEKVFGEVELKLFKGSAIVVGRSSKNMLYDLKMATYSGEQAFSQQCSPGFIELYSLQTRMWKKVDDNGNLGKQQEYAKETA